MVPQFWIRLDLRLTNVWDYMDAKKKNKIGLIYGIEGETPQ